MRVALLAVAALLSLHCASSGASVGSGSLRSHEALAAIVREIDPDASGEPGALEFVHGGVKMACISDAKHGRMRIVAPITSVGDLTSAQVAAILNANFHSALDARYATSQGILYAAFIHPLGPLSAEEVRSAVRQVASLVRTFGTSYSSGALRFNEQGQAL